MPQRSKSPQDRFARDYGAELNRVVDSIFNEVSGHDWGYARLACEAGLSRTTVWMIGEGKTLVPRFRTVYKMARAVGMHFELCPLLRIRQTG